MLADVPAGYRPFVGGDDGSIDFDQAVQQDDGDDARSVLTSAGFEAGYQRVWSGSPDGLDGYIVVIVYRFASGAGAETYGFRLISQASEDGVASFSVKGVPGARGLRSLSVDDDNPYHVVILGRGPYLAAVVAAGAQGTDPVLVSSLAREQFDLLG